MQENHWDTHRLECGLTQRYLQNTAEYLLDNCELPDKSILKVISTHDAAETLNLPGKWPRSYSSTDQHCPKCSHELSQLTKKRQRWNKDCQLIVTKLHVIVIDILVRKCKRCHLIVRPNTLQQGLLNVGDTTLVSVDVFFSLRNTVR